MKHTLPFIFSSNRGQSHNLDFIESLNLCT